jgi:nucleotide-binding universal stress UspA family protein
MITTIVVAVDETEPSQRALERAAMLAKAFDSHLVVTTVLPANPSAAPRSIGPDPVETEAEHRAELAAARAYLEGESLSAEYVEAVGHEGQSIVTVARERSADLIVIGTREPPLLVRLLGNAVADVVTHHARCDVLIVH